MSEAQLGGRNKLNTPRFILPQPRIKVDDTNKDGHAFYRDHFHCRLFNRGHRCTGYPAGVGYCLVRVCADLSTHCHGRSLYDVSPRAGRSIILGLEFLIAGDIIRTVVVADTLENVAILGLIILMRTFLSITLHLEIEGRWPWQSEKHGSS